MIKTEYICDKCKAVQPTREQFWAIRVSVRTVENSPGWQDTFKEKQWCRTCVESIGMLPQVEPTSPFVPPSFEDVVREIIRDEVDDALTK